MMRRAALLVLALSIVEGLAWGAAPGPAAPAQDEDVVRNTAHVRRSPDVEELTLRAPGLAREGRWLEALAIYERALEGPADAVVPLDGARAQGVRAFALARLAEWPEEGKAVCRRRFDPVAEQAFAAARRNLDAAALERLAAAYPFGSHAAEALVLAGTLRLDAGDAARAAESFERALAAVPADPAVVVARLGLALAALGEKERLLELAGRAEGSVLAGGRDTPLAERLRALAAAASAPRPSRVLEMPGWEMPGGAPAGWRLAESGVRLPRFAWNEIVGLPRLEAPDEFRGGFGRGMSSGPTPEFRPLLPAVADGVLYVQNGVSVTAYNLFGRGPEQLWQFRVPPPGAEVMFDNRVLYSVSVHEGIVYANLIASSGGAEDQLGYVRVKFPFPRRALYALDAATGRLLWKLGGVLHADGLAENASFGAAPTPAAGRLYVGAVRQKLSTDPFEHHVLCLDPVSGRILWSTFVASGGTEINLFGNSIRESLGSPVAVSGDVLVYSTHHGVVAALERDSGRLRWTYQYRQLPVNPTRSVYVSKNRLEWVSGPPVLARGVAVVAPADSHFVLGLDLASGAPLWERARGSELRCVYGARGGAVVLGGRRLEILDLRTGEALAPPLPDSLDGTGRGVVAEDGILVPCRDRLRKVGWDGQWNEDEAPAWPSGPSEGGNLLVVDGAVLLAGQDRIEVYSDPRDQERAIREALQASPDDPALLYRGALRYLQSGRPEEAAPLLARAAEKSAPECALHRMARRRLFAVSLEGGKADLDARRPEQAAAKLERALRAAPDPASEVEARVQLAQAHLAKRDDARAVAEFQRLLEERGEELYGGSRVFEVARKAIALVLSAAGRDVYAAQEESARKLLETARKERTADAYRKVFLSYPNSLSAEEGLFEAAQAEGRLGRPEEESSAWRRFLAEFPASGRAPEALAALAGALERRGQFASAAAALRRLLREFPDARVPDGEGRVAGADFALRRLREGALARTSAPPPPVALTPPLRHVLQYKDGEFREGVPLRPGGTPPPGAEQLLLMHLTSHAGAAVKAIDLVKGAAVWSLRFPTLIRFSAFLEDGLLLADESSVVRLDPRTGRETWRFVGPPRMRGHALVGAMLGFLAPDPRNDSVSAITALDALTGRPVWSRAFEGVPSGSLFAAGDAFVFTAIPPLRLHVFEADTGRRVGAEGAPSEGATPQIVHVSSDLALVLSEGRFVEALDLPSGRLRWRVALAGTSILGAELSPAGLVLLGMKRGASGGPEAAFLSVIHLKSGKLVRVRENLEAGDPRYLLVGGETAYVVSRETDGSFAVRAVALEDLEVRWTAAAGGGRDGTLLPPALVRDHVVVTFFEQGADGKYGAGASLLDKGGIVVQNIRGERIFERPPLGAVVRNAVVLSVDNRVDVYR
jgi:outer membrane protein assembly factor BamB/TolA-binding protein